MRAAFLPTAISILAACTTLPGQSPGSLAEVFHRVSPSVVTLQVESRELAVLSTGEGRVAAVDGIGSGVLVEGRRILTAAHVVQVADKVNVYFFDGTRRSARVIASLPGNDLAMLELDGEVPERAKAATLGNSDDMRVGEHVFVVGAPRGIPHTMTAGYLSARRLQRPGLPGLEKTEFFQTDAAINQGNSGGPMFNMAGEVVGIVSHIVSKSGGSEGLGFAVTSNVVRKQMLETSGFWSGVDGVMLEPRLASLLNVPDGRTGFLVTQISKRSPLRALKLRAGKVPATLEGVQLVLGGDIVLEVQGVSCSDPECSDKIREALTELKPGQRLTLQVLRAGKIETLSAVPKR